MAKKRSPTRSKRVKTPARPPVLEKCVVGRTSADEAWTESISDPIMSRFGAGFDIGRECAVGSLLMLHIDLPSELRSFDKNKPLYSIVGMVQQCNDVGGGTSSSFHVSVIFVAKQFPKSYLADPTLTYRLVGSDANGLWKIVESKTKFKPRRFPRYMMKLGVDLGLISHDERSVIREQTFTRDVSSSGVSVVSKLDAKVGDKIKFASRDIEFYAIAIVVKRRNLFGMDDVLHLKFIDDKLPIERILFSKVAESELITTKTDKTFGAELERNQL